jgi:hypothetical protein
LQTSLQGSAIPVAYAAQHLHNPVAALLLVAVVPAAANAAAQTGSESAADLLCRTPQYHLLQQLQQRC